MAPSLVPDISLSDAEFSALHGQRYAIPVADAVFRIEGPGAMECLQGLLTNDVLKPLPGAAIWGAFLTPKGMIVTDAWVLREARGAWVLVPHGMRQSTAALFARTIPPRLATVSDHTGQLEVRWLCGSVTGVDGGALMFRPHGPAPFAAVALLPVAGIGDGQSVDSGSPLPTWHTASPILAELSKVLMGWPTLGREIDERTLPQEVRFDELGGVKYDKGCYTGQETVARLHFRGHANRVLRGVCWAPGDRPTDLAIADGDRAAGTLRTVAQIGDRSIALAMLRREITPGDMVRTGESEGVIIEPPFDLGEPAVA